MVNQFAIFNFLIPLICDSEKRKKNYIIKIQNYRFPNQRISNILRIHFLIEPNIFFAFSVVILATSSYFISSSVAILEAINSKNAGSLGLER